MQTEPYRTATQHSMSFTHNVGGRRWHVWQQPEPHGDSIQSNREDSIGWLLRLDWKRLLPQAQEGEGLESLGKITNFCWIHSKIWQMSIIEHPKTRFCRSMPLQLGPITPAFSYSHITILIEGSELYVVLVFLAISHICFLIGWAIGQSALWLVEQLV